MKNNPPSHLDPTETGFDLELFHQLPCLTDAHGAVHRGVSFHPAVYRHPHVGKKTALTLITLINAHEMVTTVDVLISTGTHFSGSPLLH